MRRSRSALVFFVAGLLAGPADLRARSGEVDTGFNSPLGYRVLSQPAPDPGAGPARSWTDSLVVQPDGGILVSGDTLVGTTYDVRVQRLTPDGREDSSFGTAGVVTIHAGAQNWAGGMALQSDGRILVGGQSRNALGTLSDAFLARLLPNGELDASFGTAGLVTLDLANVDYLWRVVLQPDGRIIAVAGMGDAPGENERVAVLRFLTDGALDPSFGTGGVAQLPAAAASYPGALALAADGSIFVSGAHFLNAMNDQRAAFVAKLDAAGNLVAGFGQLGVASFQADDVSFEGVAVTRHGKILAAGFANLVVIPGLKVNSQLVLARFNADGTLDTKFAAGQGAVFYGEPAMGEGANSLLLQPNGKIVCVGYIMDWDAGNADLLVTRFLPNGKLDPAFGESGVVRPDLVREEYEAFGMAVSLQQDRKILVAANSGVYSVVVRLGGAGRPRFNPSR